MTNRIFPYPILRDDLQLTISNLLIDGTQPHTAVAFPDQRIIDLSRLPYPRWAKAEFHVEVIAPAAELHALEEGGAALSVTAVAMCSPANMRQLILLERSPLDRTRWTGKAELERRNFRGKVLLKALLTGTVDGFPHRLIGEAVEWMIHFDEPSIPFIDGALPVKWVDFKEPNAQPAILREHREEAFYADLEADPPTVYLNKGFPLLAQLLTDRPARRGPEQALHDAERLSIARSVWMGLFNAAQAAIIAGEAEEDPDWPSSDWQKAVLKILLDGMYPHLSATDQLRMAVEARTSDGARAVASEAQAAIGKRLRESTVLGRALYRLYEEVGQ
jgi:hypothetical protein